RFSRDWSSDVCSSDLVGATGLVTVGVTVANEGNIHGEAGLRLTLQKYVPAQEEDMGDFIFVRDAHWLVVDAVETGSGESVLLPRSEERRVGKRGGAGG